MAMSLTFHLLQLSAFTLLAVMIISFSFAGAAGTWLYRKYVKVKEPGSQNEITGMVFSVVGGFYGLLLAFIVFLVWDQFNSSQTNADIEGSMAKGLYRDIRFYPDTAATARLRHAYKVYINNVLTDEYILMKKDLRSRKTVESFNKVYEELELMQANTAQQSSRIDQMFDHINDLATYRNLRLLDADSEIPFIIWMPILIGGFITLLVAMMVDVKSLSHHIRINALLGAFIGLIFYLVIVMDHPFTGEMCIQPRTYRQIWEMQSW